MKINHIDCFNYNAKNLISIKMIEINVQSCIYKKNNIMRGQNKKETQ